MKNSQIDGGKAKAGGKPRAARTEASGQQAAHVADADLHHIIRTEAYLRAEQRGFVPGADLHDWFEAERDVKSRFAAGEAKASSRQ